MQYFMHDGKEILGVIITEVSIDDDRHVLVTDNQYNAFIQDPSIFCVKNGCLTRREDDEIAHMQKLKIDRDIVAKIKDIDSRLDYLDIKSVRPMKEIALGLDTDGTAQTKLADYNSQITALRTQRAALSAQLIN